MGVSVVSPANQDHMDVQSLDITGIPYWMQCSGELASSITSCSTQENRPCISPRQPWVGMEPALL